MTATSLADSTLAPAVLRSLADGVYITDRDRRILYWNPAAERITGWHARDIVGTSCFDDILVHEDVAGQRLCGKDSCPLHRAIIQGDTNRLPELVFARARDGARIPVEVTVAPLKDDRGRIVGGIESFRDLSPLLEEIEQARLIQEHAMRSDSAPDARVSIHAVNKPHAYISGDFCRWERIAPDVHALMIADVMGHGVAAALFTMQIRSLWEESRRLLPDPAGFLAHLNAQLGALTRGDGYFATAFYGIVDLGRLTIQYASAGHPPPLLAHAGAVRPLQAHGAALGLMADSAYTASTEPVAPGDALLAYSDGAIELTDRSGEELGGERLMALFGQVSGRPPAEALPALAESLLAYSGAFRFEDDVMLLGLRINRLA